ncbi:MAG: hypothetical protein GF347_04390 [Candidatus Moranbacteria bacterium]|nr:hypothetical protein [Candidatus Moranbacteria bacterium]
MKKTIQIKLISHTKLDPQKLLFNVYKECYGNSKSEAGKEIDIEEKLFNTGHHTPFSHFNLNFQIKNVSIGDVIFGLHLVNPFYNSDQKSGSFGLRFYNEEDIDFIEDYIKGFWALKKSEIKAVIDYVKKSHETYQLNLPKAQNMAQELLKKERPYASDQFIEDRSEKIAQEQLRIFIPSIFPTNLVYSINLLSLAALYESSWNPVMRFLLDSMAAQVINKYPDLSFLFKAKKRKKNFWYPKMKEKKEGAVDFELKLKLMNYDLKFLKNAASFIVPRENAMYEIDKLHYLPIFMNNNLKDLVVKVNLPIATMSQDQRYRTIRRSRPVFTGDIYLSVIAKALGLAKDARKILVQWRSIYKNMDKTLATVLAPLGAMVEYTKKSSLNSICHEQAGRLCWHNTRDIYELSRQLRSEIKERLGDTELVKFFEPPCYRKGKCWRGPLYCGRDLINRQEENYFVKRLV